jgi:hypothetical protein
MCAIAFYLAGILVREKGIPPNIRGGEPVTRWGRLVPHVFIDIKNIADYHPYHQGGIP